MDALELAREHDRMCRFYGGCRPCPIYDECKCYDWTQVVPLVEKWSKEHPPVRNVDHGAEALEKAGFEVDKEYMAKYCCPPNKYFKKPDKECRKCSECREWWQEEYHPDINVGDKNTN